MDNDFFDLFVGVAVTIAILCGLFYLVSFLFTKQLGIDSCDLVSKTFKASTLNVAPVATVNGSLGAALIGEDSEYITFWHCDSLGDIVLSDPNIFRKAKKFHKIKISSFLGELKGEIVE